MKDKFGYRQGLRCFSAAVLVVVMGSLAGGCGGGREPAPPETAATTPVPEVVPPPPAIAVAPVGRADLLAAARAAADEAAAGNPMPAANAALVNRNFEIRLPFGCGGAVAAPDRGGWSFDADTRVLRVSIRPDVWTKDPLFRALAAGASYDAAEGFWMERPWTRSEDCPPQAPSALAAGDPQTVAGGQGPAQTFAVVQFLAPDAPRTLRRGQRPYAYTGKVPEGTERGNKGFRLKLTGRIAGFGDGQPIHCAVTSQTSPPTCAVAVELDGAAIEDALNGETLAQWGG